MVQPDLSPDEYARWLTPRQALEALKGFWNFNTARHELFSRLRNGLVRAVAEQCVVRQHSSERDRHAHAIIPAALWGTRDTYPDNHFWDTGSITISDREHQYDKELSYFGVRFDPDQIGALATAQLNPLAKLPGGQNHDDAAPVQLDTPPQQPLPLRDLPTAEAENFSRAILAGWPQTTEEVALQKAKLFFPDNKVPKDWFLKKFRVIRGPKTRGKQPKTRY